MKVCVRGYAPIVIPPELALVETGAFDGNTPYVAKLVSRLKKKGYLANKLPAKLLCLEALKTRMLKLGGYGSLAEPMAGVGLSVRILANSSKFFLNDADESCQQILKLNFFGEPTALDVMTMPFPKADTVFLDFNNLTLKRYLKGPYTAAVDRAFDTAEKFVILNDCSVFYFRYGESSYRTYSKYVGIEIHDTTEYFKALAKLFHKKHGGWWLVEVAYFKDTAFLLFARKQAKFNIRFIENPDPIVRVEL